VAEHELKVQGPYFNVIANGNKPFEVRRNDRAYQSGDVLVLREFHPYDGNSKCWCGEWQDTHLRGHFTARKTTRIITFVYSGDPRFGGIEPGFVVLGLGMPS
jgi:hypothetical protein